MAGGTSRSSILETVSALVFTVCNLFAGYERVEL